MRRRELITILGGAATSSVLGTPAARTQEPAKLWRVGILLGGSRTPPIDGFLQGMHELGYVAGRDYVADWRAADGRFARFPVFAQDFVRLKADVILLETAAAVDATGDATIPIVMGYSIDPVGSRPVASLARPGGNVTGLAGSTEDTSPKQLELLKAVVPNLSRVGVLLNPESSDYSEVQTKMQAPRRKPDLRWCGSTRATREESTARIWSSPANASRRSSLLTTGTSLRSRTNLPGMRKGFVCHRSIRSETTSRPAG
jgi:putative ABC transport system substrate-binding protein